MTNSTSSWRFWTGIWNVFLMETWEPQRPSSQGCGSDPSQAAASAASARSGGVTRRVDITGAQDKGKPSARRRAGGIVRVRAAEAFDRDVGARLLAPVGGALDVDGVAVA